MTRQEFLEELRVALQGKISQSQLNEHLRYYDNYIMEEARKGKTEQQVIEMLGSPYVIARTLVDTADTVKESNDKQTDHSAEKVVRKSKLNHLITIVVAVLIIIMVAKLMVVLLPIVIPVVLIFVIGAFLFGKIRK